jgi:hypothetical protein
MLIQMTGNEGERWFALFAVFEHVRPADALIRVKAGLS